MKNEQGDEIPHYTIETTPEHWFLQKGSDRIVLGGQHFIYLGIAVMVGILIAQVVAAVRKK